MKMFRRITIGMVLAGVAGPSIAAGADREDLALCKSELKKIYGEDTRLKLKSIKKQSSGNKMRIQSIVDGGSYMATCWVDKEGDINVLDKEGVALEAPEYDTEGKVSLND
jgi:hypothetical protein